MLHHFAALACEAPERMKAIVDSLVVVLPCPVCRDNLKAHMAALPYPRTAKDVPKWLYRLHVRVNKAVGSYKGGEKPPLWRDIKDKYCIGGPRAEWGSIWIFLEAVVQTYEPAAAGDDADDDDDDDDTHAWRDFWDGVLFFMGTRSRLPVGALKTRSAMSAWLGRLKKKVGVTGAAPRVPEDIVVTKCQIDSHAIKQACSGARGG